MTPHEVALLHHRLQQIGDVLSAIANMAAVTDPKVWGLIDDIKRGMNTP